MLKRNLSLGLLLVVITTLLSWLYFSANRTIDTYQLKSEIRQVKESQIAEIMSNYLGVSFWQLDLAQLHADIVRLDWVYRAKVKRHWPGKVEISILEQKPVVRWGEDALLNQNGDIFYPQDIKPFAHYVRLDGETAQSRTLLKSLVIFQKQFDSLGWVIDQLSIQADGVWEMHFTGGQKLILPPQNWSQKLSRFSRAFSKMKPDLINSAELYDLRYSNGFVVKRAPKKAPNQQDDKVD